MSFGANKSKVTDAADVAFDNGATGLAATQLQEAVAELDTRSIFMRKMEITADVTIPVGHFAIWVRPLVRNNVEVRIEATAMLRVLG